jgi:preprotein translocase subunit SecY
MKRFIETLKNIYKIEDLRFRIGTTLFFLLIYRLGSFISLPGIDPTQLGNLQSQTSDGLLGLINMFSGGAFAQASIFALGIMPYISASIVIQLLGIAVPYFQRLQKEGESGRRKINQITRYLTVLILIPQASAYLTNLHYQLPATAFGVSGMMFNIPSMVILTAGSMFVLWLGERITDKGIGNGISLIIMIGIIANLPMAVVQEFASRVTQAGGGLVMFLVEWVILFIVFMLSILLVQGTRRIPVQYAKRIVNKQYVNAAGVMPIIFAQAIMMVPITIVGVANSENLRGVAAALSNITGFWYNFTQFMLVVAFTYFYTAITINPTQMAEDMKKNGGFIPGVKPGKKTVEFLDAVMSRITLPGSIFLGLVTILPAFAMLMGINQSFAYFFGEHHC